MIVDSNYYGFLPGLDTLWEINLGNYAHYYYSPGNCKFLTN